MATGSNSEPLALFRCDAVGYERLHPPGLVEHTHGAISGVREVAGSLHDVLQDGGQFEAGRYPAAEVVQMRQPLTEVLVLPAKIGYISLSYLAVMDIARNPFRPRSLKPDHNY